MHACMYVGMNIYVYVYIYIYILMYIQTKSIPCEQPWQLHSRREAALFGLSKMRQDLSRRSRHLGFAVLFKDIIGPANLAVQKGAVKSVQVLLSGIEAVVVLTLINPK